MSKYADVMGDFEDAADELKSRYKGTEIIDQILLKLKITVLTRFGWDCDTLIEQLIEEYGDRSLDHMAVDPSELP